MGSIGVVDEDESQPITSIFKKCKSSRKLLDECGAFNGASVPRKLRTASKKQRRESITPLLPISRKQRPVSNGVETLKKYRAKKSNPIKKRRRITKDEVEVAETLFALADMFSSAKNDKSCLDEVELSETKSSTVVEAGRSTNEAEDTGILSSSKISGEATPEAACHSSNFVDSTEQVSNLQQQSQFLFGKQDPSPSAIHHYKPEEKNYGLFLSSTGALCSETQGSRPGLPPWFGKTNCTTQPRVVENSVAADKIQHPRVAVESKKSWKTSSAHVYISRLIKNLQQSEKKESSNQLTTNGGLEVIPHLSINNQTRGMNGAKGINSISHTASEKNSTEIQNAILLHKRLLQDQQQATKTFSGSDFLSLAGEGINGQFHASYQQSSKSHTQMLSLQTQNQYSFTVPDLNSAHKVQLPPFLTNTPGSGNINSPARHQPETRQHEWISHLSSSQYINPGAENLWQSRGADPSSSSLMNCAQALFPHLHSALGLKYQQQLNPSQQRFVAVNSPTSLLVKRQHHLSLQEKWLFATQTGNL